MASSNDNRTVLITGASTGIGQACATTLAANGWHVFAGVRREQDADRLSTQSPGKITPVIIDVTDAATIQNARAQVESSLGDKGLVGLVNNAGIGLGGPIEFVDLDRLREQFEVNVFGQVRVIQAFAARLRQAKGRMVNMSSISGRIAIPFLGPYAASKFALEAISDALRLELRPHGVHVSVIEPGSIATPIWEKARQRAEQARQNATPETTAVYGNAIDAFHRIVDQSCKKAEPVDIVVKAVTHALNARRPKIRYLVGSEANMIGRIRKVIPTAMFDWMIATNLKKMMTSSKSNAAAKDA